MSSERYKRVVELRRGNAATAIPARKIKRQRTRATTKRAALRDAS